MEEAEEKRKPLGKATVIGGLFITLPFILLWIDTLTRTLFNYSSEWIDSIGSALDVLGLYTPVVAIYFILRSTSVVLKVYSWFILVVYLVGIAMAIIEAIQSH